MKMLELFCGTGIMSRTFKEHGHDIRTLDFDDRFSPVYNIDILEFEVSMLDGWKPDVIWASPDCSCFSVASIGSNWKGGKGAYIPKGNCTRKAVECVKRTITIINELEPKLWFIENPRGVLRKLDFMQTLPRHTVTYCQYGDSRMKPTDIWTNSKLWKPRPMCKNGDPCHDRAPRGAKTGTQGLKGRVDRARIPRELCAEICEVCEDELFKRD